ncbi:uncharacterized protein LOC144133953 [Amblyomma americanum]
MASKTRTTLPDHRAHATGVKGNPPAPATPCPSPSRGSAHHGRSAWRYGVTPVPGAPGGEIRGPERHKDSSLLGSPRGMWHNLDSGWAQMWPLALSLVAMLTLFSFVAGVSVGLRWGNVQNIRRLRTLEPRAVDRNATSPRASLCHGDQTDSHSAKPRWHREGIYRGKRISSTTAESDQDSTSADSTLQDEQD